MSPDGSRTASFDLPLVVANQPLHKYRLSAVSYAAIEVLLSQAFQRGPRLSLAPYFVLWAAERYRLYYDGGVASWEFLTAPLKVSLDQADLRAMTRAGLSHFGRTNLLRSENGTQYLRTLAAEGGIPLALLSSDGVWQQAISGLISDIEPFGLGCSDELALGFANARTASLSMGYRTEEFRRLFAEFAREVVGLRAELGDGLLAHDVCPRLDELRANWREEMVLRLDERGAERLLSQIVSAPRSQVEGSPLRRVLYREGSDWHPRIEIAERGGIEARLLDDVAAGHSRLRLGPSGMLASASPHLLLMVERDASKPGRVPDFTARRISGRRGAQVPYPLERQADFVAIADGKVLGSVALPAGGPLAEDELTIWAALGTDEEGEINRLVLVGTGGMRTRAPSVWVRVPGMEPPIGTDGLGVSPAGNSFDAQLWRVEGKGRLAFAGWSVAIETGSDKEARDEAFAVGSIVTGLHDAAGAAVYRGVPDLWLRPQGEMAQQVERNKLKYKKPRQQRWQSGAPLANEAGTFYLAQFSDAKFGCRVRVRVVPPNMHLSLVEEWPERLCIAGGPPGWHLTVAGAAPVVLGALGDAEIELASDSAELSELPLHLADPVSGETLALRFSLRRRMPRIVDSFGRAAPAEIEVSPAGLSAWQLIPAQAERTDLILRVMGPNLSDGGVRLTLPMPDARPLSSFENVIRRLLVLGGPDSELRVRLAAGLDETARLYVRDFSSAAVWNGDRLMLSGELATPIKLEVDAINLHNPSQSVSLHVASGARLTELLDAGCWFIAPSCNGELLRPPRPFVRPEERESSPLSMDRGISEAMRVAGEHGRRKERISAYATCLRDGLSDADIEAIGRVVDFATERHIGASFDQCIALAQAPVAAVRVLLAGSSQALADRLSLEMQGGPVWTRIAPEYWAKGIAEEVNRLKSAIARVPGLGEHAEGLAMENLQLVVRDLLRLRPELMGHVLPALIQVPVCPKDLPAWVGRLDMNHVNAVKAGAALEARADEIVRLQSGDPRSFSNLVPRNVPDRFRRFSEDFHGYLGAPLLLAEIAYGRRPARLNDRQEIALLHLAERDPDWIASALPLAMTWCAAQT
ncbi:STY4851/ECs_5259 family protein [Limimaricola cinnabarinus]|uniref:STY4851/ECs_5259 family protein n=1 Tax=Limimaricola cinnabarinus TaxID=1125964 RepID=UPI0026584A34|nr:STY4851/ECs_5259 family protein [Limimaricola cinnabarinus]